MADAVKAGGGKQLHGASVSPNPIYVGLRFNNWSVLAFAGRSPKGHFTWKCQCLCGSVYTLFATSIRRKSTIQCKGCAVKARKTHGHSGTPTYKAWENMHSRCKDNSRYVNRGITVCRRWGKYEHFLSDMGEKPMNLSLDRENNNLGYSKANCRWATATQQANNTSRNVWIEFNDERHTLSEWARILKMPRKKAAKMFGVPA